MIRKLTDDYCHIHYVTLLFYIIYDVYLCSTLLSLDEVLEKY
jgi:hypothetical protein